MKRLAYFIANLEGQLLRSSIEDVCAVELRAGRNSVNLRDKRTNFFLD